MKLTFVFVSKDGSIQQAAGFVLGAGLGEQVGCLAASGHAGRRKLVFSYCA